MWLRSRFTTVWLLLGVSYYGVLVAGFASYAHAYDKIWLYYAYQVAWKLEGSGQTYILRHLDPRRDGKLINQGYNPKGNRGSLPDGQLTWPEFLSLLGGRETELNVPSLTDDLEGLASKIWQSGWVSKLLIVRNAASDFTTTYDGFLQRCGDMIVKARKTLGDDAIATELSKLDYLGNRICTIRKQEFTQDRYLGEDLRNIFPEIKVQYDEITNPDPRVKDGAVEKTWHVVNAQDTLNHPDSRKAIKAALKKEGDNTEGWKKSFMERVNFYGNEAFGRKSTGKSDDNPFKDKKPYDKASWSHSRALKSWTHCYDAVKKPVC